MRSKVFIPSIVGCAAASLFAVQGLGDDKEIRIERDRGNLEHSSKVELRNDFSHQVMASQLLNASVKDNQGNSIGTVKDVILDPKSGSARFAIIKLSEGDTYKPVPWTLLNSTGDLKNGNNPSFTLNVDKSKFDSAHSFNNWPDYNFNTWGPRVYTHYGVDYGVSAGSSGVDVDVQRGGADWGKYGPVRSNGNPIDNGTAPDGKGTFYNGPHGANPISR